MTIDEVRNLWDAGAYKVNITVPKKLPEGHIFDEDLSVKKNREMLEAHNARVEEIRLESFREQSRLSKQLSLDSIQALVEEYSLTEPQARRLQAFVNSEYHSDMYTYFEKLDTLGMVVREVLDADSVS